MAAEVTEITAYQTFTTCITSTTQFVLRAYFGNEYFSAGFGIMLFTTLYEGAYSAFVRLVDWVKEALYFTVTVASDDPAFSWIEYWISKQAQKSDSLSGLSVKTEWSNARFDTWGRRRNQYERKRPTVTFLPADSHTYVFNGTPVYITRKNESRAEQQNGSLTLSDSACFSISVFGYNRRQFLQSFINHCMEDYFAERLDSKLVTFKQVHYGCWWIVDSVREARSLDSIILDGDTKETIVRDIETFSSAGERDYYLKCNITHNRGYLFYGPSGTGKTCFTLALASHFKMNLVALSLAASHMDDYKLYCALASTPKNCIISIEDIDSIFIGRKKRIEEKKPKPASKGKVNRVTFAGLLNALDGAAAQDGRIVIMTTRHIDQLSPALIRPGRIDVRVKFDLVSHSQMEQLFRKIFADNDDQKLEPELDDILQRLLAVLPERTCSVAQLQEYFLRYRKNPNQLISETAAFLEDCAADRGLISQHISKDTDSESDSDSDGDSDSDDGEEEDGEDGSGEDSDEEESEEDESSEEESDDCDSDEREN